MRGRVGVMGSRMRGRVAAAVAGGIVACALGAVAVSGREYSPEEVRLRELNQELAQTFDTGQRERLQAEIQDLHVNAIRGSRP